MAEERRPRSRPRVEREPTGDRATPAEPVRGPGAIAEAARRVGRNSHEIEEKPGLHGADQGPPPRHPASVEQALEKP